MKTKNIKSCKKSVTIKNHLNNLFLLFINILIHLLLKNSQTNSIIF
jgi:hypothetical protein